MPKPAAHNYLLLRCSWISAPAICKQPSVANIAWMLPMAGKRAMKLCKSLVPTQILEEKDLPVYETCTTAPSKSDGMKSRRQGLSIVFLFAGPDHRGCVPIGDVSAALSHSLALAGNSCTPHKTGWQFHPIFYVSQDLARKKGGWTYQDWLPNVTTNTNSYIYIYIYVCVYVCRYVWMYVCMYVRMYVCMNVNM